MVYSGDVVACQVNFSIKNPLTSNIILGRIHRYFSIAPKLTPLALFTASFLFFKKHGSNHRSTKLRSPPRCGGGAADGERRNAKEEKRRAGERAEEQPGKGGENETRTTENMGAAAGGGGGGGEAVQPAG